jgi:hypothetical protein
VQETFDRRYNSEVNRLAQISLRRGGAAAPLPNAKIDGAEVSSRSAPRKYWNAATWAAHKTDCQFDFLECEPADGMSAAAEKGDFGTSR